MSNNPQLFCPIRGTLKAKLKAKSGLTFTEEKRRIDCINLLLSRGYPKDRIEAETVMVRFGQGGKNSLRADVVVYDQSLIKLSGLSVEDRRAHMKVIAEIKRDSSNKDSAIDDQLRPALLLVPNTDTIGIYWDDVEQLVLFKEIKGEKIKTKEAAIATLPTYGSKITIADIKYNDLEPATDLVKTFQRLDDILHQAGLSKDERYTVLFQILLLKVFDEQSAKPQNGRMIIQDFSVRDVADEDVEAAFEGGLAGALTVYGTCPSSEHLAQIAAWISGASASSGG